MYVRVKTQEEWDIVSEFLKYNWIDKTSFNDYKSKSCINLNKTSYCSIDYIIEKGALSDVLPFEKWAIKNNIIINKKEEKEIPMKKLMFDVLEKTYNSPILRRRTVPLFMGNPGLGKTSIIKSFADGWRNDTKMKKNKDGTEEPILEKPIRMYKLVLSQRMPNEVVGGLMPSAETKSWEVYDSQELLKLQDGDILFIDEVFNGTLKQTLDSFLNLLEDRTLPSGKKLADVMIVAASNPQGLINLTPQIKERFIRYDLVFDQEEYKSLLQKKYGIPASIGNNICTAIRKEQFKDGDWNYITPRSIEKAIIQLGNNSPTPYDGVLLPILNEKLKSPRDIELLNIKEGDETEFISLLRLIVQNQNIKAVI